MTDSPWPRIGWRNLGRHRKRTVLTALGLAVGYFACVFITGWTRGIMAQMVENATSLVSGQIEIHDAGYRPDRRLFDTIGGRAGVDVAAMLRVVDADPAVVAAAPRVYAGGLVSSGDGQVTSAATLLGIDPARETALTRFLDPLVAGRLPAPGRREIVIGEEMSRQIESGVDDEVVLVGTAADGSMANDLYTVTGLFRTGLVEFDAATAVMPIGDLQTLIVLDPGRIHEIAVATADPWAADAAARRIADALAGAPGADSAHPAAVASWAELNPAMVDYAALSQSMSWVIVLIVFFVVLFGVANTMLMATFERRREFAVMLALGATPRAVVGAVLYEALAIAAVSLALAGAITFPLMIWWHTAPPGLGWFFGDVTLMGALIELNLRIEYVVPIWIWAAVALVVTTLLAALYPAARAARVPPADTLSGL